MTSSMQQLAADLRGTLETAVPMLLSIEPETAAEKPAPGKWSSKEILGHLIDSASNNHHKILRTKLHEMVAFPAYEQDLWVSAQHYQEEDWYILVELWRYQNLHLAHIIERLLEEELAHQCSIGNDKPVTLEFIATDYLRHLRHHLLQIIPALR